MLAERERKKNWNLINAGIHWRKWLWMKFILMFTRVLSSVYKFNRLAGDEDWEAITWKLALITFEYASLAAVLQGEVQQCS